MKHTITRNPVCECRDDGCACSGVCTRTPTLTYFHPKQERTLNVCALCHRTAALRRGRAVRLTSKEPQFCTSCGTNTALTKDWTLWPWPDGQWLCSPCNDTRHEHDDYDEVARDVSRKEHPS